MSFVPDLYPNNFKFTLCAFQSGGFQSFCKEIKPRYLREFSGSRKDCITILSWSYLRDKNAEIGLSINVDLVIFG